MNLCRDYSVTNADDRRRFWPASCVTLWLCPGALDMELATTETIERWDFVLVPFCWSFFGCNHTLHPKQSRHLLRCVAHYIVIPYSKGYSLTHPLKNSTEQKEPEIHRKTQLCGTGQLQH